MLKFRIKSLFFNEFLSDFGIEIMQFCIKILWKWMCFSSAMTNYFLIYGHFLNFNVIALSNVSYPSVRFFGVIHNKWHCANFACITASKCQEKLNSKIPVVFFFPTLIQICILIFKLNILYVFKTATNTRNIADFKKIKISPEGWNQRDEK